LSCRHSHMVTHGHSLSRHYHRQRVSLKMPVAESPTTWQLCKSIPRLRNGSWPRLFLMIQPQVCTTCQMKTRRVTRVRLSVVKAMRKWTYTIIFTTVFPLFLVFHLPESQVTVLGGVDKLNRGEIVFAVYPDTTSFYQATVVQSLRKASSGGGSFVMVNFVDDSDEHGITHDKAVLLEHIMRPPYGAVLQWCIYRRMFLGFWSLFAQYGIMVW